MTIKEQAFRNKNKPFAESHVRWINDLKRQRQEGPSFEFNKFVKDGGGFSTRCVHSGTYEDPLTGNVGTPLFASTTFQFSETTYESFLEGFIRDIPTYTRYGNPSQWSVQLKLASLENAESALVMSSGMSSISTTLLALSNRDGHIISSFDVYGGSYALLRSDMHQFGRSVSYVDSDRVEDIESHIQENTQIVFLELMSNPLMKVADLIEISALCKKHNLLLIIDNTFLTPVSCRPLDFGADIVIHSGTKYLGGHSDLTCGVAAGSRKLVDRIWAQMLRLGGALDPFVCFLLERSLKTLAVRMDAHEKGARAITKFLASHPKVRNVHSPYIEGPMRERVVKFAPDVKTGVMSFELEGGDRRALELLNHLKYFVAATSLGGVESLVSLPFNTSHSGLTLNQQKQIGLNPGLVRLSVGIENPEDLCADLDQAFKMVYQEEYEAEQ